MGVFAPLQTEGQSRRWLFCLETTCRLRSWPSRRSRSSRSVQISVFIPCLLTSSSSSSPKMSITLILLPSLPPLGAEPLSTSMWSSITLLYTCQGWSLTECSTLLCSEKGVPPCLGGKPTNRLNSESMTSFFAPVHFLKSFHFAGICLKNFVFLFVHLCNI